MKKYYKTKREALKALEERHDISLQVYKMPKGTKRHGEFAVCSHLEFINTY